MQRRHREPAPQGLYLQLTCNIYGPDSANNLQLPWLLRTARQFFGAC